MLSQLKLNVQIQLGKQGRGKVHGQEKAAQVKLESCFFSQCQGPSSGQGA